MHLKFIIPRQPEKQTYTGERLSGAISWESHPHSSPACRTVRPVSAWLAATLTSFPGWLWATGDPWLALGPPPPRSALGPLRSALGPPAGSAPAPSPACITHLLYGRPLLPRLREPPSSASLLHPLGVSSSCQVRFCPSPSNLTRQGLQRREGLFRKQPSTEAKPTSSLPPGRQGAGVFLG